MRLMQPEGRRWALVLGVLAAAAALAGGVLSAPRSSADRSVDVALSSRGQTAPLLIGQRAPLKRLYSAASAFNTPIPADPPLDPNSRALVQGLASVGWQGGFLISVKRWTVPVYLANAATKRYRLSLTAPWAPIHSWSGVPIPAEARPDPSADAQMAILDQHSHCEYDLWEARKQGQSWSASWANRLSTIGPGSYPHGLSARGSGFALLAGMIWPQELMGGQIRHALIFSYPYTSAAGFVAPATESDGTSTRSDALPEGARLQLDPTLDISSLPPYERVIARALQRYGMYLADTGSAAVSLYAVSPQSYARNPYISILPSGTYVDLSGIPLSRFRVIRHGPVIRHARSLVPSGCGTHG